MDAGIVSLFIFIFVGGGALYYYLKWVYRLIKRKGKSPEIWFFLMFIVPFGILFIPWYLYYLPSKNPN